MGTPLEGGADAFAQGLLAPRGWTAGKHDPADPDT
jgi:hypothetical protein